MPPAEPLLNAPEFTVSELSQSLKRTVEDAFGHVRVRGEISGFRGAHSSGHCYFALKDESAKIEAVIWKGVHGRMRFKPQEGLEVIATGKLTTYPGSSKYQIVIEALEPAGIGALMALMEERKKKLAAEGLFDEARKQLLPWLPEVIGVVTSPTGAVIRDILHRLEDRFPRRVLVWPVKVQGDGSAEQVAAAIRGFNALPEGGKIPRPDVLIVARGGGSLEDLWSFNEEIVVRAAAESMIPLISAVGHETDITLIDFVADKRAPTPTAAAEMAVPVRSELFVEVADLGRRTRAYWQRAQESRRSELRAAARALPAAGDLLAIPRQRLDSAGSALPRCLKANTHAHFRRFTAASSKLTLRVLHGQISQADHRLTVCGERLGLSARSLLRQRRDRFAGLEVRLRASRLSNAQAQRNAIARQRERTHRLAERAGRALATLLHRLDTRVENSGKLLSALSYRSVLARGFALVRDEAGHPVHAADAIGPGARVEIEFADGRVGATADADRAAPAAKRAPSQPKPVAQETKPAPKRVAKPVDQGSLF
ncbi:exodeoxyribonuclease VII large subunit [Bradyrhizobium sp. CCBAU 25338]|uniref:exodeoxyribonuclease VII large subunit n=1 Tax=Bradyrhizobium sp. CCBAU 25338 TaxID=1641877 RepID=UPI002302A295|nr:exodeoxyribonuclease VII large subunit [Bradyrhizobium sp. CCBAU 25338]MDA9532985.1 exodeoxyribonuclease VII large subunit [Bradyrhizobium sp. CCBAU 25338]